LSEIIDIHTHLGDCRVFDLHETVEELMTAEKKHGVSRWFVQPFPGAPDATKVHNEIARLMKEHPGKVYGLVSLNPHMEEEAWKSEVERLVRDEGFVGVKIHTIGHSMNPLGNDATKVFQTAKKLGVPVMVHTGPGVPFSLPAFVLPRAKEFPDVNIVLAHAGWGIYVGEALASALTMPNIYVEPSHVGIFEKGALTGNLAPERILFGSDIPYNVETELLHFRTLVKDTKSLDKILGDNARRLFKLR